MSDSKSVTSAPQKLRRPENGSGGTAGQYWLAAPPEHRPQDLDDPVPTKDRPVSEIGLKFSSVAES